MKKSLLLGLFCFCLILSNQIFAQNTNPFEIEERMDSMGLVGEENKPDTLIQSNGIEEIAESDTSSSLDPSSEKKLLESNPFEISHIPLRSSELEKVKEESSPIPKEENKSNSFPFWLILFTCALLAVVISLKKTILGDIRRSVLNDNTMRLLQREESGGNSFIILILYFMFFINAALFVSISMYHFGFDTIPRFILLILGIMAVYLIRHISLFIMGNGFPVQKETSQFNFAIILYNILIGIVLIPINLMLAYGPESMTKPMIYLGLGLILLIYILRQLRGLFISYRFINYYKFHFFLYLCTCEIAPLFILVKILTK